MSSGIKGVVSMLSESLVPTSVKDVRFGVDLDDEDCVGAVVDNEAKLCSGCVES